MNEAKIETFDSHLARDSIRMQLDQMNSIMEQLGFKQQVYTELQKILDFQQFHSED